MKAVISVGETMSAANLVDQWRAAYEDRRWADAVVCLEQVDAATLPAPDLDRAATAMWLAGRFADAVDLLARAHAAHMRDGDIEGAARSAVWSAIALSELGERARAGGWAAKARELTVGLADSSPSRALALVPGALMALFQGQGDVAEQGFSEALAIARRSRDGDATALACLGTGQARIMRGDFADGVSLLDEAMVAVTAGEVSPVASGIIYCAVIGYCRLAWDVDRASEWTAALERWCNAQSTMVAFSGQCEANRAELLRLHGHWDEALACSEAALRRAEQGDADARFSSHYQLAEVLRLRGRFGEADESYRAAGETGWPAQPGLALLHLVQGRTAEARSLLVRALQVVDPGTCRTLLPALVEIELAGGAVAAAREAVDELRELAATFDTPLLNATSAHAAGSVLRAEGDPTASVASLQKALMGWIALDAPYHAARCRAELALAFTELGDEAAAAEERSLACREFERLGAVPDLRACEKSTRAVGDLSAREMQVLRLIATGVTNRQVAAELTISEKTVARHMENIFGKLGVSSRSAATAWAFAHRVV